MLNKSPVPRVSIGIPVFNGEKYLSLVIESILAQTYENFELIICDNASTDGTETICRDYAKKDARIRYFRNPENLGAAANHNKTFKLSVGEFFKWCAHDDLLAPTYLEQCIAALDSDPNAVAAQPIVGCIDSNGALIAVCETERLQRAASPRASDRFAALGKDPRPCYEVFALIRRAELAKTELIAPYPWSDITVIAELCLIGRFCVVPQVLFFNRDHPDRFTHAALSSREASWSWWCGPNTRMPSLLRFYKRCPNWQIQVNLARAIKKHLPDAKERHRTYFRLVQHIIGSRLLLLLIAEPITALHPRILKIALQLKRWVEGRSGRTYAAEPSPE